MTILLVIYIFLEILTYIIIFDVILSWLTLVWIKFRPKLVADIIDPMYKGVKKIIPTTFWPFEFTPIIILILIMFIRWALFYLYPDLRTEVNLLIN